MLCCLALAMIQASSPELDALQAQVSPQRLRATVEHLASYPTRNTLSADVWEAAEWLRQQFGAIPGVQAELMRYRLPKGRRVLEEKEVVQVVARIPGRDDRSILIGAHLDSLNLQADPLTGRAPGANDDASGVALLLELARCLATRQWQHTLIFAAFTGEEQGLHGARALATRATQEGWNLDAMLNNDTVGSSSNKLGQKDASRVRLFSDDTGHTRSRELARFIEFVTRDRIALGKSAKFGAKLVLRKDRFGRGGDHSPFHDAGFPAVRFVEVHEEYTRQHTVEDLPQFMDWNYLANVTRMNLLAVSALADAGPAPTNVQIVRDQSHDTTLRWRGSAGVRYVVYWRDTASAVWQGSVAVGETTSHVVKRINKDDHVFAVGADGGVPVEAQ